MAGTQLHAVQNEMDNMPLALSPDHSHVSSVMHIKFFLHVYIIEEWPGDEATTPPQQSGVCLER